jgi:hypothetical protein
LLKTSAVAALLWLVLATPPALADSLLTGIVRDAHGASIAGALVTGLDRSGAAISHATTDPDGTFALESAQAPDRVRITCKFCRPLKIAVVPGEPVVAVVQRYDALLSDGPSAADIMALPYTQIENALALRPFEVLRLGLGLPNDRSLSDRGLGNNALVLDGDAPTYDIASYLPTALATMPTHSGNVATFEPSSRAYQYGAYATGGLIAISRDPATVEQGAWGSASAYRFSAGGPNLGVSLGSDSDDYTQRERIVASGNTALGGGIVDAQLSTSRAVTDLPDTTYDLSESSATLGFTEQFERVRFRFSASDAFGTQGFFANTTVWNDSALNASAATRFGVVDFDAGAVYSNNSNYAVSNETAINFGQGTLFVHAHVPGRTSFDLGVAHTTYDSAVGDRNVTLPSLMAVQSLGDFAVTAGYSTSLVRVSEYGAPYLAALAEAHLDYSDGQRLRAEIQTYGQGTNVADSHPMSGTGVSLAYQITPTTTIRAWTLRLYNDDNAYAGVQDLPYVSGDSLWITQQNGRFRLDAVYRRTASQDSLVVQTRRGLDGDVYFPLTASTSIGMRSELRPQGRRSSLVVNFAG